jgi:hypothetical protein
METPMNALPNDDDPLKPDATFLRGQRRFVMFCWIGSGVIFGLSFLLPQAFVPRPIKVTVTLSAMAVLIIGIFGFLYWLVPRSPMMKLLRPTARRLVVRIASPIVLYLAVFAAVTWYYQAKHPVGIAAALIALASAVPFLVTIRAVMLFLKEETDEFLRARMLESWAIATGMALTICTVWGFLDQFEVVPHLPLWAVLPVWAVCLFPSQQLVTRGQ